MHFDALTNFGTAHKLTKKYDTHLKLFIPFSRTPLTSHRTIG